MRKLLAIPMLCLLALTVHAQANVIGNATVKGTASAVGGPPAAAPATALCNADVAGFQTTWTCTTSSVATAGGRIIFLFHGNDSCTDATRGVGTITDGSGNVYDNTTPDVNLTAGSVGFDCIISAPITTTVASGHAISIASISGSGSQFFTRAYYISSSGTLQGQNTSVVGYGNSITIAASAAMTANRVCVGSQATQAADMGSTYSGGFTTYFANTSSQSGAYMGGFSVSAANGTTPSTANNLTASDATQGTIACY